MDYQTKEIICLNNAKTFSRILTVYLFVKKKVQKKLKIVELFTKRNKLSVQRIAKLFKGFYLYFVFTKVKEIENSSADYQTKEIIF